MCLSLFVSYLRYNIEVVETERVRSNQFFNPKAAHFASTSFSTTALSMSSLERGGGGGVGLRGFKQSNQ